MATNEETTVEIEETSTEAQGTETMNPVEDVSSGSDDNKPKVTIDINIHTDYTGLHQPPSVPHADSPTVSNASGSIEDISNPLTISTSEESSSNAEHRELEDLSEESELSESCISASVMSTVTHAGSDADVSALEESVNQLVVSGTPRRGVLASEATILQELPKSELVVSGSPRKGVKVSEETIDLLASQASSEAGAEPDGNNHDANSQFLVVSGSPRKGKVVCETTSLESPEKPLNILVVSGSPRRGQVRDEATSQPEEAPTGSEESESKTDEETGEKKK